MKMKRTHLWKGRFAAAMAGLCLAAALSAPAHAAPITEDEVLAKIERHATVTGNAGAEAKWRGVLALVFGGPGDAMSVADLEAQVARSKGQPWQAVWDGVWEAWEAKLAAQQQQDPPTQQDEQPEDQQQQPAAAPPVAAQDEQPQGFGSPQQQDEQQDQQQQLIGQGQQDQLHPRERTTGRRDDVWTGGTLVGDIKLQGDNVIFRGIKSVVPTVDGTGQRTFGPSLTVRIGADGTGFVDTHGGGSYFSIPGGSGVGGNFIANMQAERTPTDFRAWGYWAEWSLGPVPTAVRTFSFGTDFVQSKTPMVNSLGAGTATYRGEAVGMATYLHGQDERVIAFTDAPYEATINLTTTPGDVLHSTLKLGEARWRNPGSSATTENWRDDIAHLRKDVSLPAVLVHDSTIGEGYVGGSVITRFYDGGQTLQGVFEDVVITQPADPGNGRTHAYASNLDGAFSAERQ